jgi:Tfp pilus assembly protein PilX
MGQRVPTADLRTVVTSLRREHGQALPLVLFAMLVLTITTTAIITGAAVNHRSALQSTGQRAAFGLAQQGLADAEGVLFSAVQPTCGTDCVPTAEVSTDTGSYTYSGTLAGGVWTLVSSGTANGVSRSVSTQVVVNTSTTQSSTTQTSTTSDATIWSYLYVNGAGCTSLSGGSQIKVPLYVQGSFCMSGGTSFTGSSLQVGKDLTVPDSGSTIGSSSSKIASLNFHGTCTQGYAGQNRTCNGNGPTIWAKSVSNTLTPPITMPTYDQSAYYTAQKNAGSSGCPAGLLDNDSTYNTSAGTVNLFPVNSSYDCKVGSNELKWNAAGSWTVGTLYINGSFVVDGNLSLSGGMQVEYTGAGTLFLSGTASISGGSSICGGYTGTANCGGWNPGDYGTTDQTKAAACVSRENCNVLIVAANCNAANSTTPANNPSCIDISGGTTVQFGAYATKGFSLSGGSSDQGPVLCDTMSISGGTNITTMLPFINVPPSAPQQTITVTQTTTNYTTTSSLGTPYHWNG